MSENTPSNYKALGVMGVNADLSMWGDAGDGPGLPRSGDGHYNKGPLRKRLVRKGLILDTFVDETKTCVA